MRSLVVFIVMAVCVLQVANAANSLNTWQTDIGKKKSSIQSTVNTLVRHQRDLIYNLKNKLFNTKFSSMENVNSIVNPTLNNIEESSPCYATAKAKLRDLSLTAFSDLDKCSSDALATIKPSQDNIEGTIQLGNNVIADLNSVMLNCYSSNMLTMNSCIAGKMVTINGAAQVFESSANSVKSSSTAASGTAVTSAFTCNQGIVNTLRQRVLDVQLEANSCIKNL